jgi:uncharacterized membrane protein
MNKLVKTLSIISVIMLTLDFIFLSANQKMFEIQIADVQRVSLQFRPMGAILCYIALVFGLYYFIIKTNRSPLDAFLLGLVINAVYEGTSYAILKKWKWQTVVMDTLWGGVLLSLTTIITYKLLKYLNI